MYIYIYITLINTHLYQLESSDRVIIIAELSSSPSLKTTVSVALHWEI